MYCYPSLSRFHSRQIWYRILRSFNTNSLSLFLVLSHPDSNRRLNLLFKYLKTLFTQAQISVQTKHSQWLNSQPTGFRVCHFCTRGCHGYESSKRLRRGETMPSHREQTWHASRQEPEHLIMEMEASDWTLRGNACLRRPLNTKRTDCHCCAAVPVFGCHFEANLTVDSQTVITQVICHVYMPLPYTLLYHTIYLWSAVIHRLAPTYSICAFALEDVCVCMNMEN